MPDQSNGGATTGASVKPRTAHPCFAGRASGSRQCAAGVRRVCRGGHHASPFRLPAAGAGAL